MWPEEHGRRERGLPGRPAMWRSMGQGLVSEAVAAMREITSMVERAAVTVAALGEQSQKVGGASSK